jgi:hypothetical protein
VVEEKHKEHDLARDLDEGFAAKRGQKEGPKRDPDLSAHNPDQIKRRCAKRISNIK